MDRYGDSFIPVQRSGSNVSMDRSSNSSGMVPDYDPKTDRDLVDRVSKMSVAGGTSSGEYPFRWKQQRQIGVGAFGTVCILWSTGNEVAHFRYISIDMTYRNNKNLCYLSVAILCDYD